MRTVLRGLVERLRRLLPGANRPPAAGDRSRIAAARVTCTEQDGALTLRLTGEDAGRAPAPYLLLSRAPLPAPGDGPCLEISDRRGSVHGGIQDAYLSPQLLRLTLDASGAEVLGADAVCVTLGDGIDQRRLERALARILRGVPFTSERSLPEAEAVH